jgi:hypothetical protein
MTENENKIEAVHGARAHALLSASGASRWMNCTASARLEEPFTEARSIYADEGTLAHEFAEINLKQQLGMITDDEHAILAKPFRDHPLYTDDMEDEVQKHVDFVIQQFREAQRHTEDALLLIENKIDLTDYIEDGFGTNDDVIISDGIMDVIDLKYGKGVKVYAKENPQLKLYGLGALVRYNFMYDIHTVRLHIVQPRLDHIDTWEISVVDLLNWGETEVKTKAKLAYEGGGEPCPGDWCKWCKFKPKCRALRDKNLELIRQDFAEPKALTDAEILDVYKQAPNIIEWLSSVANFVSTEALGGKYWPGYKLVEGKTNRAFTDPKAVIAQLEAANYPSEKFMTEPKLQGITVVEKLVGKDQFPVLLHGLVAKPQGKPTLVDENDKRPEYRKSSADDDFGTDDPDDDFLT